jgi:hypothetical protein
MLWFTNFYGALVAAVLVFMRYVDYNKQTDLIIASLLIFFILILSVLGFQLVIALSLGHENYLMNIEMILNYWNKTGFYKDPEKPFHFKVVYRKFFETTISLFLALLVFCVLYICKILVLPHDHVILLTTGFLTLFILIFIVVERVYKFKWKKEFDLREEFIKKIRSCKKGVYQYNWDQQFRKKDSKLWRKIRKHC